LADPKLLADNQLDSGLYILEREISSLNRCQIVLNSLFAVINNVFFHPLRRFPGPKIAAATPLYYIFWSSIGRRHRIDSYLHTKYGEVVRTAPDRLSFLGDDAWKDIFMHRQGHPQMAKFGRGNSNKPGSYSIINAPDDVHARQRKSLSHAFSEKAVCKSNPRCSQSSILKMIS
jgi:hypothetical protein